jgi:hypothetical protein
MYLSSTAASTKDRMAWNYQFGVILRGEKYDE